MSSDAAAKHRPSAWLVLGAVAAGLMVGLFARADAVLADDWLLFSLFADPAATTGLDWSTLVADLWTPWLFNEWRFYRPASSLCMGLWLELFNASPVRWNVLCSVLHAVNVGLLAALLPRLGLRRWPAACALAFVVVHPAIAEPLTWFSAAPELVAVAGTLAACLGVCRRREERSFGSVLWVVGLWLALAGKESGTVALLALPLVDRALGARPLRVLLRDQCVHAAPALVLVAAGRAFAGCLHPMAGIEGYDHSLAHFADSLVTKLGLVLVPGSGLPSRAAAALAFALVVLACVLAPRFRARLVGSAALVAACLVFATHHFVAASYLGSRLLYGAVFASAVLLGWLASIARGRGTIILTAIAVGALLVAAARAFVQREREVEAAGVDAARVTASLREAYHGVSAPGLLCPVTFPDTLHETLAFVPNLLFPIVEGQTPGENRLLPLCHLTSFVYGSQHERGHALPVRAAVEVGATLLAFGANGVATPMPARRGAGWNEPWFEPDAQHTVRLPQVVSPFQIEAVVVEAPHAAAVQIRWLFADGATGPPGLRHQVADGEARIEVGDDFVLLAALAKGGVAGLVLDLEGVAKGSAGEASTVRVRVLAEPSRLAPPPALPALVSMRDLRETLRAPAVALAKGACLRMGCLLPSSGTSFDVQPGERVVLPRDVDAHLAWTLRIAKHSTLVYWFHEVRDDGSGPRLGARTTAARVVVER